MTADEILATVPTCRIHDRAACAAAVQVFDSARSLARLEEIGRHMASESLHEWDRVFLLRMYGWTLKRLRRGKEPAYGYGIPETA